MRKSVPKLGEENTSVSLKAVGEEGIAREKGQICYGESLRCA